MNASRLLFLAGLVAGCAISTVHARPGEGGIAADSDRGAPGRSASGPPVISIRLEDPGRQLAEVLKLFRDAAHPHPPAALVSWKQRLGDRARISKTTDALLSLINPEMVLDLRALHAARFLWLGSRGVDEPAEAEVMPPDAPRWVVDLPSDAGLISAMLVAQAMTEGRRLPALNGRPVERLAGPGGPVAMWLDEGVRIASSRDDLDRSGHLLVPSIESKPSGLGSSGGWSIRFELDPMARDVSLPETWRALAAVLRSRGGTALEATLQLHADTLSLEAQLLAEMTKTSSVPPSDEGMPLPIPRTIEPAWLRAIPMAKLEGAISLAIGNQEAETSSTAVIVRFLDDLTRLERTWPGRQAVAPLQLRLDLLALGAGVRPALDLWPLLQGVTLAWFADGNWQLGLHTHDTEAAETLGKDILPRLTGRLDRFGIDLSGEITSTTRRETVWMSSASIDPVDPDRSLAAGVRDHVDSRIEPTSRLVYLRPDRLPPLQDWSSAPATGGAEAVPWDRQTGSPLIWLGGPAEDLPERAGRADSGPVVLARERIVWTGLDRLIARLIARLADEEESPVKTAEPEAVTRSDGRLEGSSRKSPPDRKSLPHCH